MTGETTMRMWGWSVCAGAVLLPLGGRAEPPAPERRTVVLVQPLSLGLGQVGAGVEHALGAHVALAGSVQGRVIADSFQLTAGTPALRSLRVGLGVDPGVHVYLAGRAPEGLWVGPHLEATWERLTTAAAVSLPEELRDVTLRSGSLEYGGSARMGYTAILAPGLSAQVGLGLTALREDTETSVPLGEGSGQAEVKTQGAWTLAPRLTVGVGWAF